MIRSISTVAGETRMESWASVAVRFSSCFVVYLCES